MCIRDSANPSRLRDLPVRAARAGAKIALVDTVGLSGMDPFDLVFADVPCSGSGAWRRSPEGKWNLNRDRLKELCGIQASVLEHAAVKVRPGGVLAYVTCSLLKCENEVQISDFIKVNQYFKLMSSRQFTPLDGGDGFYFALLTRSQ
jgi:16S rRNA (cytosine967-C5)-methyltransferase